MGYEQENPKTSNTSEFPLLLIFYINVTKYEKGVLRNAKGLPCCPTGCHS